MKTYSLVVVLSLLFCDAEFPNSSDPITASPPVKVRGSFCGTADIFTNLKLPTDGDIAYSLFEKVPCPDTAFITGVVLRFDGAIRGVQFDRYGAIWVGGIEVLRTTTPEPTPAGIQWHIDRDLTEYISLFERPQNVSISIPNTVNEHYTGVLVLNVSFDFYMEAKPTEHMLAHAKVLGVLDPADVLQKPWEVMRVAGNGWLNVSLPAIPQATRRLFLDVFASGHGCEEFEAGYDCGGPLRRLRVYVSDLSGDKLAGVTYPFPVIYTGGVNPLLWRPLTGISSFDLPPYRFEITPFIPLLLKHSGRRLSITMDHDTSMGFWLLDPILVSYISHEEHDAIIGGKITQADLFQSYVNQNISNETTLANDRSDFSIRGELFFEHPQGRKLMVEIKGTLSAWANYTTIGPPGGPTTPPNHRIVHGQRRGEVAVIEVDSHDKMHSTELNTFDYPYRITLNQTQNHNAFDIYAVVSYARKGSALGAVGGVSWSTQITAEAVYQRSENFSIVLAQNHASEDCDIHTTSHGLCYRKRLKAQNGSIAKSVGSDWSCGEEGLDGLIRHRIAKVAPAVMAADDLFV